MSGSVAGRRVRDERFVVSTFRSALLLGTVLASPGAALAENIAYSGGSDYSLTRTDTVSGGPRVIDITTSGTGSITINVVGVQVANSTVGNGVGISADTTAGSGTVTITSGTITASGTQSTNAIDARIGTGDASITSGTVSSDATGTSHGIYVLGDTGNVTIHSDSATGARRGIFVNTSGNTNVVSGTAIADGANAQSEGIIAIGESVSVDSQYAAATNAADVRGGAIYVYAGDHGGVITSQTASIAGFNQAGLQIQTTGAATITSGTVTVLGAGNDGTYQGTADAIATAANGTSTITSDTITSAGASVRGIVVNPGSGSATVQSNTITLTGAGATGIDVRASDATLRSGAITTNGGGILAATTNGLSIDSGTISTSGTTYQSNGESLFADGIRAISYAGDVTVTSGSITTSGAQASGIAVEQGSGVTFGSGAQAPAAGTVRVTSTGAIATAGDGADGIRAQSGDSTTMIASTGTIATAGAGADGIRILGGAGATGITAASVTTTGNGSDGMYASGSGALSIASTTLATSGTDTVGLHAVGTTGDVSIHSGTVTTSGAGGQGIFAQTTSGNITIASDSAVTTATAVSASNNTSDAVFGYASGAGSVTITSGTASTLADYSNAVGAVGGGTISVTSGTASTTGGHVATVYAYGRGTGPVSINSATASATGNGAWAVEAHSVSGTVTINSGTATAANGNAVYGVAVSPQLVSITAANSSAAGDGFNAVAAIGGAIDLVIGTASSTGNTVGNARADAVFALASTGAVNATIGSASATGAGADGVHIVADGTAGAANVAITGTVSSAQGTGLFIDPPGQTTVTIAQGATVSGAAAGVNVSSQTGNTITNAGTVSSGTGPAILASGTTNLTNSGTISAGTGGVAVQLGASDDTVTLATGSAVTGTIAGGGGTDRAVLSGSGTTASAGQTIAAFTGFDSLRVASGYWTAGPVSSSFNAATVDSGAALELANGATGLTGLTVPTITDNGTVVINSSAAASGSTLGATTITGAGGVTLVGTGTVTLDGTNSIATTGGITVANGTTLLLTGTQGGTVTTQAGGTFQIGNGTTAGLFTGNLADNGTLVINHADNYTLVGTLTGTGTLVKEGAGNLILGAGYAFSGTTQIVGGAIKLTGTVDPTTQLDLTGSGTLDFSGTQQTVAQLSGNNPASSIAIAGGALTVDQAANTAFAGSITGDGSFTKSGTGSLNFTGTSTYTGPTTIEGGRLAVNGSIVSAVTVDNGGTLGGIGTIGGATIAAGGTYAPGNSIGTQTVNGNVVFQTGSIYAVETNADGRADRINATGTAKLAGTVSVLAQAGTYANLTDYTILTAIGGVSGKFDAVTSNFAFLTPLLSYSANAVQLTLARNDVSFSGIAGTPNQRAVATAVQGLGLGNAIYDSVLRQTAPGARASFDALSGEVYAAVPTVLIDQSKRVRDAVLDRAAVEGDGIGVWGSAMRNAVEGKANDGVAATRTDRTGIVSGIDIARNGLRIGAYGGYIDTDLGVTDRASHAGIKTGLVGGYASWTGGRVVVKVGGDYDWHDINARRTVTLSGTSAQETSKYKAHTLQLFGEADYRLIDGPVAVTPFVAYAHIRTHSDGFGEAGTAAALDVAAGTRNVDTTNAGVRIGGSAPVSSTVTFLPKATISWQHGWGDLRGASVASFAGTGSAFGVAGARLAGDAANAELGFDLAIGQHLKLGTGGYMSYSPDWSDYGGTVSVSFRF